MKLSEHVGEMRSTFSLLPFNDAEAHLPLMGQMIEAMSEMAFRLEALERSTSRTANEVSAAANGMTYP